MENTVLKSLIPSKIEKVDDNSSVRIKEELIKASPMKKTLLGDLPDIKKPLLGLNSLNSIEARKSIEMKNDSLESGIINSSHYTIGDNNTNVLSCVLNSR